VDVRNPFVAVVLALAISVTNSLIGYVIAKKASTKEMTTFMGMIFGSLAVRGIVVVALAYVGLGVLDLHDVAFALTFSISAFVALMVEVFFFHSSMEKQKQRQLQNVKRPIKKKEFNVLGFTG
jgi:hypothetical protein